jgi:hypothetical protein
MTTKTKAIMGLGLVAGLGAAVLPLASYADTSNASEIVSVSVEESVTITGVTNNAINLAFTGAEISAGTVETGTHAVTVSTSATAGYNLTMVADHAGLQLDAGTNAFTGDVGFAGIGAGTTVAPTSAAYNEEALTTGLTFAGTAPAMGVWGYRMSGWTANYYVSVPTVARPIAKSNAAAAAQVTTVTFGAQAGTTTPAGTYGAYINYVATTN